MPLTFYADESETEGQPLFVLAGFLARAEQWALFSDDWQAVLDGAFPPIKAFHMKECWHNGSFGLLPELLNVIKKHEVVAFAVLLNSTDFTNVIKGKIGKEADSLYFVAFTSLIAMVTKWQIENGYNEKVDFIFDEKTELSVRLQDDFRKVLPMLDDRSAMRLSTVPLFLKDDEVQPLQAADILAWSIRRREIYSTDNTSEKGIIAHRVQNEVPVLVTWFNKDTFVSMLNYINSEALRIGRPTPYQAKQLAENADLIIHTLNTVRVEASAPGQVVLMTAFPAKQMKRFLFLSRCPRCDNPHLHTRKEDKCLGE